MSERVGQHANKAARVLSYIGMVIGVAVLTSLLPLLFVMLGERNAQSIGVHCGSWERIAYWSIGCGAITIFVFITCGICALRRRSRKHTFICVLAVIGHFIATLIMIGLSAQQSDSKEKYLREVWDESNPVTRELIQNHFSCCGFDTHTSNDTVYSSCVTPQGNWPIGCYDSIHGTRFSTIQLKSNGIFVNMDAWNPVAAVLVATVVLILLVDIMIIVAFSLTLRSPESFTEGKAFFSSAILTISNSHVEEDKTSQNSARNEFDVHPSKEICKRKTIERKNIAHLPHVINEKFENAFYWLGVLVGKYPIQTVTLSLIITLITSIGLLQRRDFGFGTSAFLAPNSVLPEQTKLYYSTFVTTGDEHDIIITSDDVLNPAILKKMYLFDHKIKQLNTPNNFSVICSRVHGGSCKQTSILSIWNYDYDNIKNLTTEQIISDVNNASEFGNVENVLGGITLDEENRIISAKSCAFKYCTRRGMDTWENILLEFVLQKQEDDFDVFIRTQNSQVKEARSGISEEMPLLFAGFALLFVYISIMTGKISMVRNRIWIALVGVVTAGLSLAAGIGLAASLTFQWSMLHLIGPFLVLGIGVDDMFILLQTWNVVDEDEKTKNQSIEEKSGLVLKSAGVAITITSVTDLVAFAVGATSVMGPFRSFSIYVALCIVMLFVLQCTFFTGCIVLDQRRRERNNNACIPCFHHEHYRQNKCANTEILQKIFAYGLGRILQNNLVKAAIISISIVFMGVLAWGFSQLRVGYEPDWYINSNSYLVAYNKQEELYFNRGLQSGAYVINANFYEERDKLHEIYNLLDGNVRVEHADSWYESYTAWANHTVTDPSEFYESVSLFLSSAVGKKYSHDVMLRSGRIMGSRFPFSHVKTKYSVDNADIMEKVRLDLSSVGMDGEVFPYSWLYFNMEIIQTIRNEVYRNLAITLLCVFLVVLPLIGSFQMGFWVALCVILTIIEVAGAMYFAGLYIETSTVIVLLLAVGLAVDYAAHVGHKFLTITGPRNHRIQVTLAHVGPAVFNGGFSTFLALALLGGASSYSYRVFFIVFTCVIAFGLWNGLCFLPSVLGLMGPPPYKHATKKPSSDQLQ